MWVTFAKIWEISLKFGEISYKIREILLKFGEISHKIISLKFGKRRLSRHPSLAEVGTKQTSSMAAGDLSVTRVGACVHVCAQRVCVIIF